jgi:hypothetical protein
VVPAQRCSPRSVVKVCVLGSHDAGSPEMGKRAVDDGVGWTRVTRQKAKSNSRASTSEPAAKAVKVFTTAGELERKR